MMILAIRASSPSRSRFHEHRLTAHLYPGMRCANQSFIHLDDLTDAVARLIERSRDLPAAVPLLIGEQALGHEEVQNITGCALHGEEWTTVRIPQPIAKAGARLQEKVLGQDGFIKPWMVEASNDHYVLGIAREGHDHMAMMKTDEMRVRWIRKNSPLQSLPS